MPTYQLSNVKNISSNVLDLVFVNETGDVQLCEAPAAITKIRETDRFHPPLEITYEYEAGQKEGLNEIFELFVYDRGNYAQMCDTLNGINFAEVFDKMEVEAAYDYFYDVMNDLIVKNVPRIRVKKTTNPKWWTRELQARKNKRDKLYQRKPKNESSSEYTAALADFNELHETLYNEYINRIQQYIVCDPAEFWSYAKMEQKRSKYPTEVYMNDDASDKPGEIVELFADYFESVYVKDDEEAFFEDIYGTELIDAREIDLTLQDIERATHGLKAKGSAGPDDLAPVVMKKCVDAVVWPLWILHRKSMEMGKIATRLKMSRVVQEKRR